MKWLQKRRLTGALMLSAVVLTLLSLWAGSLGRAIHDVALADTAAITHGQLWRLATGPLLHSTFTHLIWDLTILGILGLIYEPRMGRLFAPVVVIGVIAPTLAVALDATFTRYYGVSGLNYTVMGAGVGFELWRGKRSIGVVGGGLLIWKLVRAVLGQSMWGPALPGDTHEAWLSHVVGAALGALFVLLAMSAMMRHAKPPSQRPDPPCRPRNRPRSAALGL